MCIQTGKLYAQPNNKTSATILLDFNGHNVKATAWNWNGPFYAEPTNLNPNQIKEIIKRVKADYDIFDLKITTEEKDYKKEDPMKRIRIIITPTSEWYGQSGGVALIGSFTWGDDTPCFVFSDQLNFHPKFIAEAVSHEVGHTLGLQHQSEYDEYCNKTQEYNPGTGNDSVGWAPIMGIGYFKGITTWALGQSTEDCKIVQDDLSLITQVLSYKPEALEDSSVATVLPFRGSKIAAAGFIKNATEKDKFLFQVTRTTRITLDINPGEENDELFAANLNLKATLLNENSEEILVMDPQDHLSVSLDTTLLTGKYYLLIEGAPTEFLPDYGSIGSYTILGTAASTLPVHEFKLTGKATSHAQTLNWNFISDEPVSSLNILYSEDGTNFRSISSLPSNVNSFVYYPAPSKKHFYRIEALAKYTGSYFSNIIQLGSDKINNKSYAFISGNDLLVYSVSNAEGRIFNLSGTLLFKTRINKGMNRIPLNASSNGAIVFILTSENDKQSFRLIKR
jgi:hypothetical protein